MLINAKELKGYILHSLDKNIGKVKDLYFDDLHWGIRYLVADNGNWMIDRQVLISPYSLQNVNKHEKTISINLTRQQIEESPALSSDKPVSQQFETSYYSHYGWSKYWDGPLLWGSAPYPQHGLSHQEESPHSPQVKDRHLRSIQEVLGYHIQAKDDSLGHVEDFIIDYKSWVVRYLVINTHNWRPGKKVLLAPMWIDSVSWKQSKVFVKFLKETIQQSPEYTEVEELSHQYEQELNDYYSSQKYWLDELKENEFSQD